MRPMLGGISRNIEASVGRVAEGAALSLIAAVFALGGVFSLIVAGAIAIAQVYGVVVAWLCVAAICLILAAASLAYASARRRARRIQALQMQQTAFAGTAGLGMAADILPVLMRASPIGTLALAAAGAYILAKAAQTQKAP